MSVPITNLSCLSSVDQMLENDFGETPLPYAPQVPSVNGQDVTPQQFLEVNRTLESVEAILNAITIPEHFLLFAGEERGLVYLMCAIVGHENYPSSESKREDFKIVYGRRWLLEPSTPTSEVIQTALLAVKKVREHELREHIVVSVDIDGLMRKKTTPFNCHIDLPLMVQEADRFTPPEGKSWNADVLLRHIHVDNLKLSLVATRALSDNRILYDIGIKREGVAPSTFADFDGKLLSVLCAIGTESEFLHELFNALLKLSDGYIDERFHFQSLARFSQTLCPTDIAKFSYKTRNLANEDKRFGVHFEDMSYRVDAAKAPVINSGQLGEQQRAKLNEFELRYGPLSGHLPRQYR